MDDDSTLELPAPDSETESENADKISS
jgi:hypothetical protein